MKRPRIVKDSGPYRVESLANGQLTVSPAWPQFRPWNEDEGGGPGPMSRMDLAGELQRWLNAPYEEEK